MRIRWNRFNIYLALALAGVVAMGCRSQESKIKHTEKTEGATLRLYQEAHPEPMGRTEVITVHKDPLVQLTIKSEAILTEANVEKAKVVDTVGGFALSIQFDRQGSWLLEQYTAAGRGKHIAIFSQWVKRGQEKLNDGHWLSAPKIATHITDGLLNFTPDCEREDAEEIARGLNNVAKKTQWGEMKD